MRKRVREAWFWSESFDDLEVDDDKRMRFGDDSYGGIACAIYDIMI